MLSATVSGEAKESWQLVHATLVDLATERAGLDLQEGRSLLKAQRAAVHRQLGYGSLTEYVERLFGYAPRHPRQAARGRSVGTPARAVA
jgi:hypothetical protein